MTTQEQLRQAARAAGWLAEYEVRGFGWVADVLCVSGDRMVALEDQLVDNRTLLDRTERYRQSGVHVAWFTPNLRRRKIARLIGTIPIFDTAEIEAVVPEFLAASTALPCTAEGVRRRCERCGAPVGTVSTYWCWSCWFRFTTPSSGYIAHPHIHLTDWNRARERQQAEEQERAALALR